jgi:hypothetical protein
MSSIQHVTYFLQGGGHIDASTPLEVVEALRDRTPYKNNEEFMTEVARRKLAEGRQQVIRTNSVSHFVHDLLMCNFLQMHGDLLERDILNYARLFMEVAVPESLPSGKWEVLIDFYPVEKQVIGLRVRVRGMNQLEVVQVERVFSPAELLEGPSTWPRKAVQFGYEARK